ncbi:MAG: hypothetical protein ABIK09_02265 [Pseudomonadota bacterium]
MRSALTGITLLFAACSGAQVTIAPPAGIEEMHRVDGADVSASFPGYEGPVFALGGDDGAHWFGILSRKPGEGPEHLLVGISPNRVWSEPIVVEAADREVTQLEIVGAWLGDLQKDGAPDLLLHLRTASRQKEGGRTHVRDVVRVFGLGKELRETWLGTVSLRGSSAAGCRRLEYDYRATPSWQQDKAGGIRSLEVKSRTILETCAPTRAECKGPVVCGVERIEESGIFVWDTDLGAFRRSDASEARFTVPDVSFQ